MRGERFQDHVLAQTEIGLVHQLAIEVGEQSLRALHETAPRALLVRASYASGGGAKLASCIYDKPTESCIARPFHDSAVNVAAESLGGSAVCYTGSTRCVTSRW